ncbi:hypothetical protein, partial [Streptococcus dysgalactiae]|uniref:hypothetical protein n=1 Tax=Streptococcus dysgalactiae TaxID=1334 RepID=UPI001950956D
SDPIGSNVTVEVPPFNRQNPRFWFHLLESQFQFKRISNDHHRYYLALSKLPFDVAEQAQETLESTKSYITLKEAVLTQTIPPENERVKQLLSNLELAGRPPSALPKEMRALVGNCVVADSFLREMWLQRLPPFVQAIVGHLKHADLTELAAAADDIASRLAPTAGHP